ncbi:MAG: pantoate--beta-alanine ligase [Phycisphaerales bacterium]|nr:pantoate--beta-alanine ligase [Phycisphaerales bacterium]
MQIFNTIANWRSFAAGLSARGPLVFVPTMGALHAGHGSLVTHARQLAGDHGHVVVSIFVNPTQFGPQEDFARYPRTLTDDVALCERCGCDFIFAPAATEMYPAGPSNLSVNPGNMGDILEGAIRPGHFSGVCTVVLKLLAIVQPTHLILGQKDYQQQAILRGMVRDFNLPVGVVVAPTVREADGLAMSSRNRYLTEPQRAAAPIIYQTLAWAATEVRNARGDFAQLSAAMRQRINGAGLETQYALAADCISLAELHGPVRPSCVLLVAAKNGSTRLIDNMLIE